LQKALAQFDSYEVEFHGCSAGAKSLLKTTTPEGQNPKTLSNKGLAGRWGFKLEDP
jgi:hypothetical protein